MMQHAPALIVLIPMLLAPLAAMLRSPGAGWALFTAGAAGSFALSILVLEQVWSGGVLSYAMGGWVPPFGIEYRIDLANGLVLAVVSGIALLVAPFARASVAQEISEPRQYLFYACMLLCLCGLLGIAATGDAFNVFVFLEISSLSAYGLIAMGRSRRALLASFQYLVMGTVGGTFLLIGIGLLYAVTGTLNMADIAERLPATYDSRVTQAAVAFIFVGLSIKVALFPLHQWLPSAYAEAPSAVTAFMAATATKVAAYAMLRFADTVLGEALVFEQLPVGEIGVLLACVAMIAGSLVAIFQQDLKLLLAYSSLAQIGYIVLGIALGTADGASAGLLHVVAHAVVKCGLFVVAGVVIFRLGSERLDALNGLALRMPGVFAALLICGMGLVGVPATAGFVSKWALLQALIAEQAWVAAFTMLASSLMAVIYVGVLIERAVFRAPDTSLSDTGITPLGAKLSLAALAVLTVLIGLWSDPIAQIANGAGAGLFEAGR